MNRSPLHGRVIQLDDVRDRATQVAPVRTFVLHISEDRAVAEAHRQFGVSDSSTLADLAWVLQTGFGIAQIDEPVPEFFEFRGSLLDAATPLTDVASPLHKGLIYHWGLWRFQILTMLILDRDDSTPPSLCVGGTGSFAGKEFDVRAVNAELRGEVSDREVLAGATAPVRELIQRCRIFDLIPVLRAMDLGTQDGIDAKVRAQLSRLPVETDPAGVDAFWATVLALSCFLDEDLVGQTVAFVMHSLGWVDDDGSRLDGPAALALCADSLAELSRLGAYCRDGLAPVDRVDIYRELLRDKHRQH